MFWTLSSWTFFWSVDISLFKGNQLWETVTFQPPFNMIVGSSRATVSVLGKSVSMSFDLITSIGCYGRLHWVSEPPFEKVDTWFTQIPVLIVSTIQPTRYTWYHATILLVLKEVMFSCQGDIMGRALKNIEKLLRMPYGCGEQNMARLAPNIYILEYLKNTDQLTPAIKEKSYKFLTSGGWLFFSK